MKLCAELDRYLVGRLVGRELTAFEEHLADCPDCAAEIADWETTRERVKEWADDRELPSPSAAEAASLVVRLSPRSAGTRWLRPALGVGLAAAASMALVLAVTLGEAPPTQIPEAPPAALESSATPAPPAQVPVKVLYSRKAELAGPRLPYARHLSVPADGRLLLGLERDRIGIAPSSDLDILSSRKEETRLRLLRGSVAADVATRTAGETFAIEARGFTVRVTGTRFGVSVLSDSEFRVAVDEGKVVVAGPGETVHEVEAGQSLRFDENRTWRYEELVPKRRDELARLLLAGEEREEAVVAAAPRPEPSLPAAEHVAAAEPAKKPDAKPDRAAGTEPPEPSETPATWRGWILEGRFEEAERALVTHLRSHPDDTRSWSLLASCRRKAGQWRAATDAYLKVVEQGSPRSANSARFQAAALLQDRLGRHGEAASLLGAYLDGPALLRAEAMVRLARAQIKTGRRASAHALLERVVKEHRGTTAALQANRLLKDFD